MKWPLGMMAMKLVRDKIPQIMRENGKSCVVHVADDKEFHDLLRAKLKEEIDEFLLDNNPEELADIVEVVHAIAHHEYDGFSHIETIRLAKKEQRGGFDKRIILEEIINKKD